MANVPVASLTPDASNIETHKIVSAKNGNNMVHLLLRRYDQREGYNCRPQDRDVALHLETLATLLQRGVSVSDLNAEGLTVLGSAIALHAPLAVIKCILDWCPDVDLVDGNGQTALMTACQHLTRDTDADVVEMLLKHGADPNAVDLKGRTPLLVAFETIASTVCRAICDADARRHSSTNCNVFRAVVRLLIDGGAKVNEVNTVRVHVLDAILEYMVNKLNAVGNAQWGTFNERTSGSRTRHSTEFLATLQHFIGEGATGLCLNECIQELWAFQYPCVRTTRGALTSQGRLEVIEILLGVHGASLNVDGLDDNALSNALTLAALFELGNMFLALWGAARQGVISGLVQGYHLQCKTILDKQERRNLAAQYNVYAYDEVRMMSKMHRQGPFVVVDVICGLLRRCHSTSPCKTLFETRLGLMLWILECLVSAGMIPLQRQLNYMIRNCLHETSTEESGKPQYKATHFPFLEKLYSMIPEGSIIVPMLPTRRNWKPEQPIVGLITKQVAFVELQLDCGGRVVDDRYRMVTVDRPDVWSLETHGQFPPAFKKMVQTLLLCGNRDREVHHGGGSIQVTIGWLDQSLLFEIVKRVAFPVSDWVDV